MQGRSDFRQGFLRYSLCLRVGLYIIPSFYCFNRSAAYGAPRYGTTGYEHVGLACTRFIGCAKVYFIMVSKLSHGSIRSSSEAVFYDVAEEAISSSLYFTAVRTCAFPHSRLARNVFATLSSWYSDGGAGPNYVVCVWSLPRGTRCRTVLGY